MITVLKTPRGFIKVSGNPVITSLDGTKKAPLRVIQHHSWTAEDRAEYGVYHVDDPIVPDGMVAIGAPVILERDGKVVATVRLIDKSEPEPRSTSNVEAALHSWAESMGLTLDDVRKVLQIPPRQDPSAPTEKQ